MRLRLRARSLLPFDSAQESVSKRFMLAIVLGLELLVADAEFFPAISHQYA